MRNATTVLLDEIREAKGITSDYKLAQVLDVAQQTITSYRHGRTQMNDEVAFRAAHMLGKPPAPLMAQIAGERAKNANVAKVWTDAAKVLARTKGR
jgi:plasmid maintenance system antidote protein VapI